MENKKPKITIMDRLIGDDLLKYAEALSEEINTNPKYKHLNEIIRRHTKQGRFNILIKDFGVVLLCIMHCKECRALVLEMTE